MSVVFKTHHVPESHRQVTIGLVVFHCPRVVQDLAAGFTPDISLVSQESSGLLLTAKDASYCD